MPDPTPDPDTPAATPIWSKGRAADAWMLRFTVGDDYLWDRHLARADARATRAHAAALVRAGILTDAERADTDAALDAFDAAVEAGEVTVEASDEDVHTVLERWLTERLGATGKKIHTGRSRNDQVVAALRLWLRDRLAALDADTRALARALCDHADAHADVLMPGYTHTQRAMPSSVGLWAAAYASLLVDDLTTLASAAALVDRSALGSAAGYGVPSLGLDREAVARDLGHASAQSPVTAVQLSRGKTEAAVAHACVQIGATLNRMASDLVLFASAEFGFVRLPERLTTGSSIMPQKRNPDVLELARAHYHRLTAELHLLLTLPANLTSGYHRDLQLTKEAVMRCVLGCADVVEAISAVVPEMTWDAGRMRAALSPDLFATGRALDFVAAGQPFRDAYRRAADEAFAGQTPVPDLSALRAAYAGPGTLGDTGTAALRAALGG